jgi:uncharacterized protein YbcI
MQDEIAKAFVQFEREYKGRGPKEASCFLIGDLVLVRLKGVLTPAEQHLSKTAEGVDLVKRVRSKLVEGAQHLVYALVQDVTGRRVLSMHADISTQTGERIFVFTLDAAP